MCRLQTKTNAARQLLSARLSGGKHKHVLEDVQRRLDKKSAGDAGPRRETVEHPFGTIKARMGGDALPDEAIEERRHRDGAARARLQSDPGDEYPRHQTADGGNLFQFYMTTGHAYTDYA